MRYLSSKQLLSGFLASLWINFPTCFAALLDSGVAVDKVGYRARIQRGGFGYWPIEKSLNTKVDSRCP